MMTVMKRILLAEIIVSFILTSPAFGQNDSIKLADEIADTLFSDFGLFASDDILKLTLRFDITHFKWKKPKDEYMKALLTYHISDKDSINKEVRLKSRGTMRNEYCDFPPIKLNFLKQDSMNKVPGKITDLKMVTHCQYGNEEYLLKEYLIYKLYNELTDMSFHVRLVRVEYINTNKKSKPIAAYAFLIEPEDMLAERTHSAPQKITYISQKTIIPEIMDRVAIFNYMIGNTDWSVAVQHNIKVFKGPAAGPSSQNLIVPFDFDFSGLVNAHYALPAEGLGLKSVRERRYLGICRSKDIFAGDLGEFREKKDNFYRIINQFSLLSESTRKDMIRYLDGFYRGFDEHNNIVYELLNSCVSF
jgi:hypothetical protein